MNCKDCPFNSDSKNYNKNLLKKINLPYRFHDFFKCNSDYALRFSHNNSEICPSVIWGIVFIGSKDEFSIKNAENILDELVNKGQAELLRNLFENSPYQIRRKLWIRMTTLHINKLYLFNQVFDQDEIQITKTDNNNNLLSIYQNYLLQNI